MENILLSVSMVVIMPLLFIIILWKTSFKSKLQWLFDAIVTILFISWLTQAANWSWISYYLRYLWPIILLFAIYFSWKKVHEKDFILRYTRNEKFTILIYIFLIVVFGYYNVGTIKSYSVKYEAIDLQFPLQDGTYYIGQGGNHLLMNNHQNAPPQKYALDILKIHSFGNRAKGIYPKELEKYYIFDDDIVSPCTGKVVEMENELPDHIPPETDETNAPGNYVQMLCDHHEADVYIAHMKRGSLAVAAGEVVEVGQFIGKVGNSGNTTEPHVHIHAELNGVGVPITFDGKFLVRNSLVKETTN